MRLVLLREWEGTDSGRFWMSGCTPLAWLPGWVERALEMGLAGRGGGAAGPSSNVWPPPLQVMQGETPILQQIPD